MKEIKITITHNLTPMHEEIMEKMVKEMMKAQENWWKMNSKKPFKVEITKSKK